MEGTTPRETASTSAHRVPKYSADYGRKKKSGVRKRILDVFLVKTRHTIEAILKTYELFIYEVMRYFTY